MVSISPSSTLRSIFHARHSSSSTSSAASSSSDEPSTLASSPEPTTPTSPTCPFSPTSTSSRCPYAFVPPSNTDTRSPCPALNTLANHGYLPHTGRDISFRALVRALEKAYGISPSFALFLVGVSWARLHKSPLRAITLHDIARHGPIEHDASLAHADVPYALSAAQREKEYAPAQLDPALLALFLSRAYTPPAEHDAAYITVRDVAYARVFRERSLPSALDGMHAEVARGEFAMALNILGRASGARVSVKAMRTWLEENRLPDGWAPSGKESAKDTVQKSAEIRKEMETLRAQLGFGDEKEVSEWARHVQALVADESTVLALMDDNAGAEVLALDNEVLVASPTASPTTTAFSPPPSPTSPTSTTRTRHRREPTDKDKTLVDPIPPPTRAGSLKKVFRLVVRPRLSTLIANANADEKARQIEAEDEDDGVGEVWSPVDMRVEPVAIAAA